MGVHVADPSVKAIIDIDGQDVKGIAVDSDGTVLTFTVYFFNLDMKLMAALEPLLEKVYDKRKREQKI